MIFQNIISINQRKARAGFKGFFHAEIDKNKGSLFKVEFGEKIPARNRLFCGFRHKNQDSLGRRADQTAFFFAGFLCP